MLDALVQWLHLDKGSAMIAASPEDDRSGGIVDEHRAHIGLLRQRIFHRLPSLEIEPHSAI